MNNAIKHLRQFKTSPLGLYMPQQNFLINPGFEIWQRGTSMSYATPWAQTFTADRWQLSGTATITTNQYPIGPGSGRVYGNSSLQLACSVYAASTFLFQDVSDPQYYGPLRGQVVCLAADVSATQAVVLQVAAMNGTSPILFYTTTHPADGNWHRLHSAAYIPTDCTLIRCYAAILAGAGTIYVDNATLSLGAAPMEYAPTSYAADLAACMRYYENLAGGSALIASGNTVAGNSVYTYVPYKVPKGAAVTPVFTGTWNTLNITGSPTFGAFDMNGIRIDMTITATGYGYAQPATGAKLEAIWTP